MNKVGGSLLTVTVGTSAHGRSLSIRLSGEVAMGAEDALTEAVARVARVRPAVVDVDLAAVTFVCSTFAKFIADVLAAAPEASVVLHNPSRMARLVLAATGLDPVLALREDAEPVRVRINRPR